MQAWELALSAVVVTGIAVAVLAAVLIRIATGVRPTDPSLLSHFERTRRARLRESSGFYQALEGWMEIVARHNRANVPESRLERMARDLKGAGTLLPWLPEEHLAAIQIQTFFVILGSFGLVALMTKSVIGALILAALLGWGYYQLMLTDITRRAAARYQLLKDRLPFAVDLMAMMMEAGALFPECLAAVVVENRDHPLGDEFGYVLQEVEMGSTLHNALMSLQERIPDETLKGLVFAITQGEKMGTPLVEILRNQSDQMRLVRSQRQEKESAEAQVSIVMPGMLIMLACLLLAVTPFLLTALDSGIGSMFSSQ